jgi:integrase
MAREINRLKQKEVENAKEPGLYPDGHGLYLRVTPTLTKNWVYRFSLVGQTLSKNGKQVSCDIGLGTLQDVSLVEARDKANLYRKMVRQGIDPRRVRKEAEQEKRLTESKTIIFSECSRLYIEAHKPGWRNQKHAAQWESTLKTYCVAINQLPVQDIDTGLALKVLEPIWTKLPETASRVRSRIESVLNWATARGYRKGDNPARWRGHLDKLLPRMSKKDRVKHHRALPYSKVYDFIEAVRKQEGIAARCAEFTILCAARTNESIAAKPEEFDLDKAAWVIPASRMKAKRDHKVPLCPRALEIAKEAIADAEKNGSAYLFPGKKGKHLSNGGMLALLDRMEWRGKTTMHGFRSSFRDWAAEMTSVPFGVAEAALAHVVGDATQQAYLRADLYEKRKKLMADWQKFITTPPAKGKVVNLRKAS